MQQAVHLLHAALRRHVGVNFVGETDQADGVALPQGDVAEHQHRVERVVEQAQPGGFVRHHAAAVDQEDHPLALVGLKVLDGQLVAAGRAAPVDVLVVVVERVVAQAFEFVVLADLPRPPHAHQAQPVGAGQQRVFGKLLHVGIDVHRRFDVIFEIPLPQAQAAADAQVAFFQPKIAAARGFRS